MTLNGNGVRDIARVLHVSPTSVIQELKKVVPLKPVNHKLWQWLKPEQVEVDVVRVEEVEEVEEFGVAESQLDEMWISTLAARKTNAGCGMRLTAGLVKF